jgi:hypothetical protein
MKPLGRTPFIDRICISYSNMNGSVARSGVRHNTEEDIKITNATFKFGNLGVQIQNNDLQHWLQFFFNVFS